MLPHTTVLTINIAQNARWKQGGVTVAGGYGCNNALNQLNRPYGLYVDEDQTLLIADSRNRRIMEWKSGVTHGQIVAGGNEQLNEPTDVTVDKETDSLIICDQGNQRVVRWSRQNQISEETIIENVACSGLAMDGQRFIYVSDCKKHEVRRYQQMSQRTTANGIVVAGGNGKGDRLDQLDSPTYIFVDREQSVYVSDNNNHRVMKWFKGAKEGIVVAGGRGQGNDLTQLSYPQGVFVDLLGTVYVVDAANNRVMRWYNKVKQGTVIVGGNGQGTQTNQLYGPDGLSFDRHGNLYVAEWGNNRVQRFSIEGTH